MIEFKESSKVVFPYNKEEYENFLDPDFETTVKWYAVSLQLTNEEALQSINDFTNAFKSIVASLDKASNWILSHDDKDLNWFPNNEDNLTSLRGLFKRNDIPNTFRGCLLLLKDDLLKYASELVSYPYVLSYKNLDISHSELPFIIKFTSHLTLDLLSTDRMILNKILDESYLSSFNKKKYRSSPALLDL